jgi:hypothetical protein
MVGNPLPPPTSEIASNFPMGKRQPKPRHAIVYCCFIEANNQTERLNLVAWLKFKCALKPYQQVFV